VVKPTPALFYQVSCLKKDPPMSRKFLDDQIRIKNSITFFPSSTTIYDAGHEFQNRDDGTIYRNEGTRDAGLFTHPYVNRIDLVEQFIKRPGVAADLDPASFAQATNRLQITANPAFSLAGTNAVSTCAVLTTGGGVKLTTTTGSGDQVIVIPAGTLNSVEQSLWNVGAQTDNTPIFETVIQTDSAITLMTIWAGLKLTNTSVTATDNDQVFIRYAAATNSGRFQFITSATGTDTVTDTGVTVAASTRYHIKITVDASRVARLYINGVYIMKSSAALTTAVTLKPYVGVQTDTTAAKSLYVRMVRMAKSQVN
jgi:hypothetical protein